MLLITRSKLYLKKNTHLLLRQLIYLLFVGCIFSLYGCTQSVRSYSSQWPDEAIDLLDSEENSKQKLDDLSVDQLIFRGNAVLAKGNEGLARIYFAMAIKKSPDSAAALTGAGNSFFRNGAFKPATQAYERALEKVSDYSPAIFALARVHRVQGNYSEAIEILSAALVIDEQNVEVLTELAMNYDNTGHAEMAEPLYRQVITLQPTTASCYNNLGFNLMLQGEYSESISMLSRSLRIEPDNVYAQNNLAIAYALSGNEERAIQLFTSAADKAIAYNNIGYLLMETGEWNRAEHAFTSALELNPRFYVRAQNNLDQLNRMKLAN
ncbi:MAG: hypothetical protein BA874_05245 [Desulfuromonadales bacterium C00003068]|nr:MAG: hypothetical protein BA874_05245 [Desulfuromonadales bacterium C00003068]